MDRIETPEVVLAVLGPDPISGRGSSGLGGEGDEFRIEVEVQASLKIIPTLLEGRLAKMFLVNPFGVSLDPGKRGYFLPIERALIMTWLWLLRSR